jgi:ribonuclease P protein component
VRKRREYELVQNGGRRATTSHFVFLQYAGGSREARLGVVASRKVGTAVVRNRCKRLVREAFRKTSDIWTPGIDLVVIVRRNLDRMKLDDVVDEWRSATGVLAHRAREASRDRERRATTPSPVQP